MFVGRIYFDLKNNSIHNELFKCIIPFIFKN